MKKLVLLFLILFSSGIFAQEVEQLPSQEGLPKPKEGKCLVYLTRRGASAFLLKISIYDGDLYLGKLSANKFFAYECDPGEHAFIAKSENTYYVDANLEEGRTYVLDVQIKPGVLYARVGISPLSQNGKKFEKEKKKMLEFINKRNGELLFKENEDDEDDAPEKGSASEEAMTNRLRKFYEMKKAGKKMTTITPDMYFD